MNLDRMEDWTQCPCCTTPYTKEGETAPHLLLCGHSFCYRDIKLLNKDASNIIGCPICNRKIGLHLYKDQIPPRNYSLTEQLDSLREMRQEATTCHECQKEVCRYYCKDCKVDLCEECNASIHRMRVFATHVRIPIEEKSPLPAEQLCCSIHENEPLRLFCLEEECRIPTCFLCATHGLHKGHNLSLIDDATPEQKELLTKECLVPCTLARRGMLDVSTRLYTAERALEVNRTNYLQAIREDFAVVRQVLNQLETKVLEFVDHESAELSKDISSLQMEIAPYLAEIRAIEFKAKVALQTEPTLFLTMVKELSEALRSRTEKIKDCLNRLAIPSVDIKYARDTTFEISPGSHHDIGVIAQTFTNVIRGFAISSLRVYANDDLVVSGFVELDKKNAYAFSSITVKNGGILTVKGWDGTENTGYLNLLVTGNVVVEEGGQINLTGRGYRGGAACGISERASSDGESSNGCAGKGGKASARFGSTGGGGGGLGTAGTDAEPNRYKDAVVPGGAGGKKLSENIEMTTALVRGSGGGGGSGYSGSMGGHGGCGGGLLIIKAREIRNNGLICSDGLCGMNGEGIYSSGGGGGSGGCIKLIANIVRNNGEITALGGEGGKAGSFNGCYGICSNGGAGGEGIIIIELADDLTGIEKIVPKPITNWTQ